MITNIEVTVTDTYGLYTSFLFNVVAMDATPQVRYDDPIDQFIVEGEPFYF